MRNCLKLLAAFLSLLLMLLGAAPAYADDPQPTAPGKLHVYLEDKEIQFDVDPIIENGTTLVQLRPIFEAMGLELQWIPLYQTVVGKKGRFTVTFSIGKSLGFVANYPGTPIDAAPQIIDGNTMVPLRFVAEATGHAVQWIPDYAQKKVVITRTVAADIIDVAYSDQVKYEGEQKDGLADGKGKYIYKDKLWYEGDFAKGNMEGQGKLYRDGTLIYEGQFSRSLPNGKGRLLDHQIYEGNMKNGLRDGYGKLSDTNGKLEYEGDFQNNTITGKGTIYQSGNTKYVGDVIMGVREGYGKLYDADGDMYYDGRFAGNQPAMDPASQSAFAVYLYAKQGKDQKADKSADEMLGRVGDKAAGYKLLGNIYIKVNKPSKAVAMLQKGVEVDAKDAEMYALLAIAYAQLGDDAKTEESLNKAKESGFPDMNALQDQVQRYKLNLK
ncbi:hypothetical protein SD70_25085 [Gordoniibacillus kamchatkensis]|uniref:Copper amine oxidase-like N-terminal domain-containing protein n=1 Tax=Gordoniibacillus kamchatkensis TaxID=1590651 RepID=A0ABR5ACE7_9BACL|nr:copper amine oxidase N-terminal domain-containing protein [Paenibacillus sp. VKM B-2647]KIL38645.1 hypothetical protein SD70_25085 [Paenibacillus sp. VKM B-2647]